MSLTNWRHLLVQCQNMTAQERIIVEDRLFAEDCRTPDLAEECARRREICKTGDAALFQRVIHIVEVQQFLFGIGQVRARTHEPSMIKNSQTLDSDCADRLPILEEKLSAIIDECCVGAENKTMFGSLRWLLVNRAGTDADAPINVRMLWITAFAAVWICSGSGAPEKELDLVLSTVLGREETLLLSLILRCLHILYGMLPPRVYTFLARINTTIS